MPSVRFVALGHVTNDVTDGGFEPGGSALYAALAATAIGARALVVTSAGPDFCGRSLLDAHGVQVEALPAPRTTCFENRYHEGRRVQRVHAVASPLGALEAGGADVLFACPVAGELPDAPLRTAGVRVVGAGLQGWLRRLEPDGSVSRRVPDPAFLAGCHVLFCSDEDLGDDAAALLPRLLPLAPVVVVTEGARGARVFADGGELRVAASSAREVDPTGAGDVFAATFLCALAEGRSVDDAGRRAACAAAIAVETAAASLVSALGVFEARLGLSTLGLT